MSARENLVALGTGMLFGAGLAVAGVTRPEVVIGFLDVTGRWDPTLGIAMIAALAANAALVAVAMRRRRPLWTKRFRMPSSGRVDRRLVAGAAVFGIGWGLVGVCPGPAIVSLASGDRSILTFVVSMTTGLLLVDSISRLRRPRETREVEGARLHRG